MDWSNVFIAGGIALASLLCVEAEKSNLSYASDFINSDIDVYVYGLQPLEANRKVKHICDMYVRNLPLGSATPMIVRNAKTITILSQWPLKRLQIVLKLVTSPRDVLLNFDLDPCAIGWDGKEVWMLPRAARAIESEVFPLLC